MSADMYGPGPGNKVDLALMKAATTMDGLDFLGFDIYTANAFADTERFLSEAGTGGKAVWINEAWSTTAALSSNPGQDALDAQWAKVLLDFARTVHAQGVSPFFTDLFASYKPPPTDARGLLAFFQGRTPVFSSFQSYETECRARSPTAQISAPC